jgi:hypothetical protein
MKIFKKTHFIKLSLNYFNIKFFTLLETKSNEQNKLPTPHPVKYTMKEIEKIVSDIHNMKIGIENTPIEFQKASEIISRLPPYPQEPDSDDCCGSGCNPCIMDVYEQNLSKYKIGLDKIFQIVNDEVE